MYAVLGILDCQQLVSHSHVQCHRPEHQGQAHRRGVEDEEGGVRSRIEEDSERRIIGYFGTGIFPAAHGSGKVGVRWFECVGLGEIGG